MNVVFRYSVLLLGSLMLLFFVAFSPLSPPLNHPVSANLIDTVKQDYYLELKGNVRQSRSINEKEEIKSIDSALISVYLKDVVFTTIYTNKKGRCTFKVPLDKQFKIVVSKKGFTTKFFEVNSVVPINKKNTFSFSFDIDLFEEVNGLDVSILQKPIAKVMYNLIVEQFVYDIKYTSRINFDIKKMYKNYYLYQQAHADSIIKIPPVIEQKK